MRSTRLHFSSARRLHVLATFEILQRLLAFELRPVERQMVAGLGIGVNGIMFCLSGWWWGCSGWGLRKGAGVSSERSVYDSAMPV